jgi:hypothetical protein
VNDGTVDPQARTKVMIDNNAVQEHRKADRGANGTHQKQQRVGRHIGNQATTQHVTGNDHSKVFV